MKTKTIICTVALLASVMAVTSCKESSNAGGNQAPKIYKTLTVSKSNTSINSKYSTSIRGEQFVDIRPQVSGVITDIKIQEGANIKKGQTLFIIDQVPYKAALDVAIANVKSAEAAVATAKLNAESNQSLYEESVISEIELQTTLNTLASAEAALALAEAQETTARNDLSYTVITSPVDGMSGMINYRVGALVSSSISDPLVSVSNNNNMYAYFSISEAALMSLIENSGSTDAFMKDMDEVTLMMSNGREYAHKGKVDVISGVINQATGSVVGRAIFPNPEQMLRDGGNGVLTIPTSYENVIVVPKIATYEIQDKVFAFKVVDGKTTSALLEIYPYNNGKEYIVEGGLEVGDIIIAEGAGLLREGTPVAIESENK